jgi:hypothetical protein
MRGNHEMKKSLNSGWSVKNITPKGRAVSLAGQYYERITDKIDKDLKVTALALDNGETSFIWVSCDLTMITNFLTNDVRAEVAKRSSKIKTENIFLSAIHTHNAPYIKYEKIPGTV